MKNGVSHVALILTQFGYSFNSRGRGVDLSPLDIVDN